MKRGTPRKRKINKKKKKNQRNTKTQTKNDVEISIDNIIKSIRPQYPPENVINDGKVKLEYKKLMWVCPKCNYWYSTKGTLKTHLFTHSKYKHRYNNRNLKSLSSYFMRKNCYNRNRINKNSEAETFKKDISKFPDITDYIKDNMEIKKVKTRKIIRSLCSICNKKFIPLWVLNIHEKMHSQNKYITGFISVDVPIEVAKKISN